MSIEKKSLISTLNTTKKANVAKESPASAPMTTVTSKRYQPKTVVAKKTKLIAKKSTS